jgi:hypothetical protein
MRVVIVGLGAQGRERLAVAGRDVVPAVDPVERAARYCRWGPATFTRRCRMLPSGRPPEEAVRLDRSLSDLGGISRRRAGPASSTLRVPVTMATAGIGTTAAACPVAQAIVTRLAAHGLDLATLAARPGRA